MEIVGKVLARRTATYAKIIRQEAVLCVDKRTARRQLCLEENDWRGEQLKLSLEK